MPKIAPNQFASNDDRDTLLAMVSVLMTCSNKAVTKHPGCRAVAWVKTSGAVATDVLLVSYSTFKHGHAEEVLAIGMAKLFQTWNLPPIKWLYVDLEPCKDKKYPGHCCSELVNGGGRNIKYHNTEGKVELKCDAVYWSLNQGEVPDKPLTEVKLGAYENDLDNVCRLAGTTQFDTMDSIQKKTAFVGGMWTNIWVIVQDAEGNVTVTKIK